MPACRWYQKICWDRHRKVDECVLSRSSEVTAVLLGSTVRGDRADSRHWTRARQTMVRLMLMWFRRAATEPAQMRAPFATIARSPDFDARHLADFLLNPHPKTPDLRSTRAAAD